MCSALKFYLLCSILCSRKILLSIYYYMQLCINKPLHKAENFRKTALLKYIYKWCQLN